MDERNKLRRAQKQLFLLGMLKIPMIGFVRPRIISINDQKAVLKVRLKRRTRNHLKSMYFGAMAVGADLAAGLHTYYLAGDDAQRMSFVFKSISAEFHKRAETDAFFVCNDGEKLSKAIRESIESGERVHQNVQVLVLNTADEVVATFDMTVSFRFKAQTV